MISDGHGSSGAFPALALKLRALGIESWQAFDAADTAAFRALITRLEDTKIRAYMIDERKKLRQITSKEWAECFGAYLQELNCPYNSEICQEETGRWLLADWLISRAVTLEYEGNAPAYNATDTYLTGDESSSITCDAGVSQKVRELAQTVLQAISAKEGQEKSAHVSKLQLNHIVALLERSAAREAVLAAAQNTSPSSTQHTLADCPLGFSSNDAEVDAAAKVLRLLYVEDLRQLQNDIDKLIVSVQEYTANPQIDSGLGAIGQ